MFVSYRLLGYLEASTALGATLLNVYFSVYLNTLFHLHRL